MQRNTPLTRIFFCDPPGRSDPESLVNFGNDIAEHNYIFFHDQEPIHLDIHGKLFYEVERRNRDLNYLDGPNKTGIVTSEKHSEALEQVCQQYGWNSYYYFYHGWAALDWYRGYDKTFLIDEPGSRSICHSYISPNRIVAGRREHRLIMMYHALKSGIRSALISFPAVCPGENISIISAAQALQEQYPDIIPTLESAQFPWNFSNEQGHPMHSCWLSLFDECARSMCYVVTETVWQNSRWHLTEKTFKPICMRMPFVLVSTAGSLKYLRSYGFQTFGDIWDESYDDEVDDHARLKKVSSLLSWFDSLDQQDLNDIYQRTLPIIQHNFDHFYQGKFESMLWDELQAMLTSISRDFA